MASDELNDIREYWVKKYPNVDITLYPRFDDGRFYGKMISSSSSIDLSASTIGELIGQGENFLRRQNGWVGA